MTKQWFMSDVETRMIELLAQRFGLTEVELLREMVYFTFNNVEELDRYIEEKELGDVVKEVAR